MFLFGSRGAYFHIGQCFKCDVPLKMFLCHLLYVCVSSDSSKH
jgi:hypothetical protein